MRNNPKLQAILGSPQMMARSRSLRTALYDRIADRSAIKEMTATLDTIDAPCAATIFDVLRPFVMQDQWATDFLIDLVTACEEEPLFCPLLQGGHDPLSNDWGVYNLAVLNHPSAIVSLHGWANRSGSSAVPPIAQMGGIPSMIKGLGGSTATFHHWSCEGFDEHRDVASLLAVAEQPIHVGSEPVMIDGRKSAIAFKSSNGPFAALQVRAKCDAHARVLEFDTSNGRLRNVLPTNLAEGRIPMMFAVLRQAGTLTESILEPYLTHSSYDIRWQAMRELLALTGVAGAARLKAFLDREPNPTVQRAGRRAAEMIARLTS